MAHKWTTEEQFLIASMPPACRKAWDAFASDDVIGSPPLLFVTAFNTGVKAYGKPNMTCRAKDRPMEEVLAGAPEHCTRPLASIPRDGTVVWIERRHKGAPGKPLKYPVALARWKKHTGPTGGYWAFKGMKTTTNDASIIGWEPVDEH